MFVQVSGITSFFFLFILLYIYFLFPLCYGSPLTHFVILLTSPHARITHVFLKKKVDRKNWYTETACSNGESQTQTRYMPHPSFFSPSFRLLFRLLFLFFFGVISGTTLPMCPLTPHASLMCIIADHCPLFLPPPSSPSYFLLKLKRSASQNGGEFYYSHEYHLSAHRSRQHTHVRARAHIHARTHIRAHAHTRKRCSPKCIGPCHDS